MTENDARKALAKVPTGMAARMLGIDPRTLYAWRDRGEIAAEQTKAGRFLWDVAAYLERSAGKAGKVAS